MNKDSKIIVLGAKGMVGSAIVRRLHELGYTNVMEKKHADLDLMNQKLTNYFFEFYKPEYVFLAAAKVGGIMANDTYRAEFIYNKSSPSFLFLFFNNRFANLPIKLN